MAAVLDGFDWVGFDSLVQAGAGVCEYIGRLGSASVAFDAARHGPMSNRGARFWPCRLLFFS